MGVSNDLTDVMLFLFFTWLTAMFAVWAISHILQNVKGDKK